MGFCDLCGCHGDYYDHMIDLKQSKLSKYISSDLSYVCDSCYYKLNQYNNNEYDFSLFHFSNRENEKKFKGIKKNQCMKRGENNK